MNTVLIWLAHYLGVAGAHWAVGGLAAIILAWALKKIPNAMLRAKFGALMYGLGVAVTLGLAKYKWTRSVWNKILEPWVIDAIDNIVVKGISEFVRGMRSDNIKDVK